MIQTKTFRGNYRAWLILLPLPPIYHHCLAREKRHPLEPWHKLFCLRKLFWLVLTVLISASTDTAIYSGIKAKTQTRFFSKNYEHDCPPESPARLARSRAKRSHLHNTRMIFLGNPLPSWAKLSRAEPRWARGETQPAGFRIGGWAELNWADGGPGPSRSIRAFSCERLNQ